jgi:hypothetical protein
MVIKGAFAKPAIKTIDSRNPSHAITRSAVSEWMNQKSEGRRKKPAKPEPNPVRTRSRYISTGNKPWDPISGTIWFMATKKATAYTIPKSLRIKNLVSQYERELFIEPNGGLKCEEVVLFIFWIHSQYQYRFLPLRISIYLG